MRREGEEEKYLFTEILMGLEACWSVAVVLSEERESSKRGDDHRRFAARTIS